MAGIDGDWTYLHLICAAGWCLVCVCTDREHATLMPDLPVSSCKDPKVDKQIAKCLELGQHKDVVAHGN